MRKIFFQKEFDKDEGAEMVLSGPFNKVGPYILHVDCPDCGKGITIELSVEDLTELSDEMTRAKKRLEQD